jgi:hypothetical protein
MADPSVCERRNAPFSGHLDAALLDTKTVAPVKSQHPVDAERSLLPPARQHLTAFLRFLIALAPVRGLLLFANIRSSQPSRRLPLVTPKMLFARTRKLSSQSSYRSILPSPVPKRAVPKFAK